MTLLEVIAALAILTFAGLALLERTSAAVQEAARSAEREQRLSAEERVLVAQTVLSRRDLDRRLGTRTYGELMVTVQRPRRGLYRIGVAWVQGPEDLVTVVYRPDSAYAQ